MSAKIRCPHCDIKLLVDDDMIGTKVECEECGKRFVAETIGSSKAGTKPSSKDSGANPKSKPRRSDEDEEESNRPPRRRKTVKSSTNAAPMIFGSLLVVMLFGISIGFYWMFGFGSTRAVASTNQLPNVQAVKPNPVTPPRNNNFNNNFNAPPDNFDQGGTDIPPPQPNRNPRANPNPEANPNPNPAPAAGASKFTLSNPRWGRGNDWVGGMGGGGGNPFSGDFSVDYTFTGAGLVGHQYKLVWKYTDGSNGSSDLTFLRDQTGTISIKVLGAGRGPRLGMTMWIEEGGRRIGPRSTPGTKVSNEVTLN